MYLSTKTLIAACLIASTKAAGSDPVLGRADSLSSELQAKIVKFRDSFLEWKDQNSKVYDCAGMELKKMLVWIENHEFIHNHNNQSKSYTLGHNHFSDMTNDEYQRANSIGKYSRSKPILQKKMAERAAMHKLESLNVEKKGLHEHPAKAEYRYLRQISAGSVGLFDDMFTDDEANGDDEASTDDYTPSAADDDAASTDDAAATDDNDSDGLPDSIDWVTAGGVTPVKNQGRCGSCWAFSTTGAMEGAHFVETGELVALSEQNLMDCDKVDHACEGGLMEDAFKFEESGNGLCSEDDYPYLATDDSQCNDDCEKVPHTRVKDYIDIPAGDKHGLLASIVMQPTSIAMDASGLAFQFYSTGVIDDDSCGAEGQIDHGVLAVGYGFDEDSGHKFYKVKNSWGDGWGDEGYFRIKRDSKNEYGTCAVLAYMTTPLLDTDDAN